MLNYEELEARLIDMQNLKDFPSALGSLGFKFEINAENELQIIKNKIRHLGEGKSQIALPLVSDLETFTRQKIRVPRWLSKEIAEYDIQN